MYIKKNPVEMNFKQIFMISDEKKKTLTLPVT